MPDSWTPATLPPIPDRTDLVKEYRQVEVNDATKPDPETVSAARRHIEALQAKRALSALS